VTLLTHHCCKVSLLICFFLVSIPSITFSNENISFTPNLIVDLKKSSYKSFKNGKESIILRSENGNINLENQDLHFYDNVEGQFTYNGKIFNLRTQNLISNLKEKSILSKERTFFKGNNIEIASSSLEISKIPAEGIKIIFREADLDQINAGLRIDKGKANKIEFFIEKDLMLMQGNAEFYEGNMRIISDEIHYSLEEDRVLKSVNAKIINTR
jgi:lipopolysaccharide export system protein LptA